MQNRCVALAELAPEIELIKSKEQVAGILRSAPKFSDVPGNSFGQEREADLSGLNESGKYNSSIVRFVRHSSGLSKTGSLSNPTDLLKLMPA